MSIINFIQKLIPNWLKISYYKLRGRRPWSRGYSAFKSEYIKKAIHNLEIMEIFKSAKPLPRRYGYRLDVRVVEHPWVLSRIPQSEKGNLLDAGSALNFKEILEFPSFRNKQITIINLEPETDCFWDRGISYVFGDMRNLLFKDNYFDYITCISTLQHIGMDNTIFYTKNLKYKEEKPFDFEKTISELKRVLKRRGKLFITVPFGKYQNFGWLQQFDFKLVNKILETFRPKEHRIDYYKYTKEGWNISNEAECRNCEYFDIYKTKYFDKKSSLDYNSDFAAASRAVACIELIK
jgi:SAM-dependent methyltransferase